MKVLITGSTGFIGYSLTKALMAKGYEVHQLVRYRAGRWNGYHPGDLHFADLRQPEVINDIIEGVKPEVVIHLAAVSAVSLSFKNPDEVMTVNSHGTLDLARACLKNGVRHFIFASTSEVYGEATKFPITEDTPLKATSPYAQSKIDAENYLRLMRELNDFPVTIMRPFNSYGRALVDNRHFVVERAIVGALTKRRISLHDPTPLRDFLFREDHVSAYLLAVEKRPIGEVYNIASGGCWSIREMAEKVRERVERLGIGPVEVEFTQEPDRPLDIRCLHGSSVKIGRELGWELRYSLEEGLDKAILEWRGVFHV